MYVKFIAEDVQWHAMLARVPDIGETVLLTDYDQVSGRMFLVTGVQTQMSLQYNNQAWADTEKTTYLVMLTEQNTHLGNAYWHQPSTQHYTVRHALAAAKKKK